MKDMYTREHSETKIVRKTFHQIIRFMALLLEQYTMTHYKSIFGSQEPTMFSFGIVHLWYELKSKLKNLNKFSRIV